MAEFLSFFKAEFLSFLSYEFNHSNIQKILSKNRLLQLICLQSDLAFSNAIV